MQIPIKVIHEKNTQITNVHRKKKKEKEKKQ